MDLEKLEPTLPDSYKGQGYAVVSIWKTMPPTATFFHRLTAAIECYESKDFPAILVDLDLEYVIRRNDQNQK